MVFILPRRLRDKFWPVPLPPKGSFDGRTVLITGATSGLGRAAAQQFATLGATVIMTSRSMAQGEAARQEIQRDCGIGQGKIHVRELDMSRYPSCLDFVNGLKQSEQGQRGIDCAVLNAGIISPDYVESPEGWEQTLQVNTLSTTLLGLLLLEWMKMTRDPERPTPHLVFIASRDHLDPDISTWADWSAKEGVLRHFSNVENWPAGRIDPNYANSKLLLMYAIRALCERAVTQDGTVQVIINSVCPGLVSTDIARSIAQKSTLMGLLVSVYLSILGKSADYGARFYITAALAPKEQHGKNIQSLFTDKEYRRLAYPNLQSDIAQRVRDIVWKEILEELIKNIPTLDKLL